MGLGNSASVRTTLAAATTATALMVLSLAGCSSSDPKGSVRGPVGSAELSLSLPDNTTITTVNYNITGPNGYSNPGMVPVGNSSEVKFQVGNIPASAPNAYSITLSASTSSSVMCSGGPVTFGITPSETALIMMTLRCGGGSAATNNGNVRVDVDVVQEGTCAEVDGLTVLPRSVNVGSSMALTGFSTVPASSTYEWTVVPASAGMFSASTSAMTQFTCAAPGTHTVTLRVSGGASCTASTEDVPVICTGAGSAGTGAAGESGAGAGGAGAGGAGESGAGAGGAGAGGAGESGAGAGGAGAGGAGESGAGAGGAGAGGMGGGDCEACEMMNATAATRLMECNTVGNVADCQAVVSCIRNSTCASEGAGGFSPSDCICGDGADVVMCATQTLATVTGDCKEIIAQGAETTSLMDISVRLADPTYATGRAIRLIQADQRFCPTVCRF